MSIAKMEKRRIEKTAWKETMGLMSACGGGIWEAKQVKMRQKDQQ